jgi:hypothetical protein
VGVEHVVNMGGGRKVEMDCILHVRYTF